MSTTIDQAFSEGVLRLQDWLQFLGQKAAEYQRQMERVRGGAPAASEPPASAPEAEKVDGWA